MMEKNKELIKYMKKNIIFTLIITLALSASNLTAVFADDSSGETPEPQDTQPAVQNSESVESPAEEEVEIFQDNENTEEFDLTGADAPENWALGGDAEMTGDGITDPEGDGWLRLTGDESYELGYAVYDEALNTENGLAFQFDYTAWGGSGADGITFFLMDGETTMEEFTPGGYGGSLGFAPRHKVTEGLSNAVVGIGIDEFGNFSNAGEGRNGGHGRTQDSISIRGAGDGFEGYEFIDGTERLQEGVDIRGTEERPDQTGEDYRNVSIMFTPVEQQFSLSLSMRFGAGTEPEQLFKDLLLPGIIPATVKFGFTASSASATNIHEVRNIIIDKAVLNDVVETIAQAPAETQITDSVPATETQTNNTITTIPVTAIQSGNTITIIPVTGSMIYPLSCNAQTKLHIEGEVFAILPALCGQEASLVQETMHTIPFALPAGYVFLNASTLAIIDRASLENYTAGYEEITVGFYVDGNQDTDNLAILVWQDGKWVEQEVVIIDGNISTNIGESTLFVLVKK